MSMKAKPGFTVIEVMLFLAVSGMLTIMLLVGSGMAINQQRYRDSVISLQAFVQQQYSDVTNVNSDREKSWTCDSSANVVEVNQAAGQARGTSDCVILGRLLTIDEFGKKLTASNVVGYQKAGAETQTSDVEEITNNYALGISPINQSEAEVSWGAQVVKPKTTTPQPLSMLVIRSPLSGAILTFTAEGIQTNPLGMVTTSNLSQQRDLCVSTDMTTIGGGRMEVRIMPYASSQSAIQVPSESDSICD